MNTLNMNNEFLDGIDDRRALVPLGSWIDAAERARVPHIPADFSPAFAIPEIYGFLDDEPAPALEAALAWLSERAGEAKNRMICRWECCSSSEVKGLVGSGREWSERFMRLTVDDPRFLDCAHSPDGMMRIAVRPWVEPMRAGGYPMEFRIFYGPCGFQGACDYYPQRMGALLGSDLAEAAIIRAGDLAERLAIVLESPVGFTADFLVDRERRVLLIDGGPPHVQAPISAHPCCFAPGRVGGVTLVPQEGSLDG